MSFKIVYRQETYTQERSNDRFVMQMHSAAFALPSFLKNELSLPGDYPRQ